MAQPEDVDMDTAMHDADAFPNGARPTLPRRTSKFVEGSMNSRTSIHPPPSAYWPEFRFEKKPSMITEVSLAEDVVQTKDESIFGRTFRGMASLFRRRKEAPVVLEKDGAEGGHGGRDLRKEEYEEAYQRAKESGALPKPQIFVRPVGGYRNAASTPSGSPLKALAQSPNIRRTPTLTKKDLQRQARLAKKVEELEHKLVRTQEKLNEALSPLPPTPRSHTHDHTPLAYRSASVRSRGGKVTKKRRTSGFAGNESVNEHASYKPSATENSSDSENDDHDMSEFGAIAQSHVEGSVNTSKRKRLPKDTTSASPTPANSAIKRMSSNLTSKTKRVRNVASQSSIKGRLTRKRSVVVDERSASSPAVTVVPDGVLVPEVPKIPAEVDGKRVDVRDDGYGGLGHEIF